MAPYQNVITLDVIVITLEVIVFTLEVIVITLYILKTDNNTKMYYFSHFVLLFKYLNNVFLNYSFQIKHQRNL